jgi:hypothetical protein
LSAPKKKYFSYFGVQIRSYSSNFTCGAAPLGREILAAPVLSIELRLAAPFGWSGVAGTYELLTGLAAGLLGSSSRSITSGELKKKNREQRNETKKSFDYDLPLLLGY